MTQLGYSYTDFEDDQSDIRKMTAFIYYQKALPLYKNVLKNTKEKNLRAITLMVLAYQSKEELKQVSQTDKQLLKTVYGNCDLYERYLNVFQINYKSTIALPDRKKILIGFANFDVI